MEEQGKLESELIEFINEKLDDLKIDSEELKQINSKAKELGVLQDKVRKLIDYCQSNALERNSIELSVREKINIEQAELHLMNLNCSNCLKVIEPLHRKYRKNELISDIYFTALAIEDPDKLLQNMELGYDNKYAALNRIISFGSTSKYEEGFDYHDKVKIKYTSDISFMCAEIEVQILLLLDRDRSDVKNFSLFKPLIEEVDKVRQESILTDKENGYIRFILDFFGTVSNQELNETHKNIVDDPEFTFIDDSNLRFHYRRISRLKQWKDYRKELKDKHLTINKNTPPQVQQKFKKESIREKQKSKTSKFSIKESDFYTGISIKENHPMEHMNFHMDFERK